MNKLFKTSTKNYMYLLTTISILSFNQLLASRSFSDNSSQSRHKSYRSHCEFDNINSNDLKKLLTRKKLLRKFEIVV